MSLALAANYVCLKTEFKQSVAGLMVLASVCNINILKCVEAASHLAYQTGLCHEQER